MDLRREVALLRSRARLILVTVVAAVSLAFAVTQVQPTVYSAQAKLLVGQSLSAVSPDYNALLVAQSLASTYATVATTRPVLQAAIASLNLSLTPDDLARVVTAGAAIGTPLITITAVDHDPNRAAAIANAVAAALIDASPGVQGRQTAVQKFIDENLASVQTAIQQAQVEATTLSALPARTDVQNARLIALQTEITTLRATYATLLGYSSSGAANLLSVIERAVSPADPVSPRPLLNLLLGGMLGLLLALGLVHLLAYLRDNLESPQAVEELTGLPTLGMVMQMPGTSGRGAMYALATLLFPRSVAAEAYRALRSNLDFAGVDTPLRRLLVTSAAPSEGKTVTAANLAIAFAMAGRRVLLVDADLRRPGVHTLFDLSNHRGLTSLLQSDQRLEDIVHTGQVEGLSILTSGPLPPNPADVISSDWMRRLFDELAETADLVIVDSAPLLTVSDSVVLASFLDDTLLVIHSGRTRRSAVRRAREALATANASVIGAVLNAIPARRYAEEHPAAGYYDATAEKPTVEPGTSPWPVAAPERRRRWRSQPQPGSGPSVGE